jgi:hypothetical protein
MPVFGLQERFEESQRRILEYVGGGKYVEGVREKSTADRPSVDEIGSLRPRLLDQLRADHELDIQLFEFATRLFEQASSGVDDLTTQKDATPFDRGTINSPSRR